MCQLKVNWHVCSHLVPQNETCQFDGLAEHKRGESTALLVDTPCWLCQQSPSEFINAMVTTQLTAQDVIGALGISETHPNLMTIIGKYFDRYENGHLAGMGLRSDRFLDGLDMPRPEAQNQNGNAQLNGVPTLVGVNNPFSSAGIQGFPRIRSLQNGLVAGNQNNMDITSTLSVDGGDITSGHNAYMIDDYSTYETDTADPADTSGDITANADILDLDVIFPTLDDHSLIALEHLESVQAHREMNMSGSDTSDGDISIGNPGLENTVRQSMPDNAERETKNSMTRKIWGDKEPSATSEIDARPFDLDCIMSEDQNDTNTVQLQTNNAYPFHSQNAQMDALTSAEHREFSSSNLHHLTVITALNHQLETQGPSYDLVQALSKEVSECAQEMQVIGERWHQLSDTVMRNINRYNALQAPAIGANGTSISHDDDDELLHITSIL